MPPGGTEFCPREFSALVQEKLCQDQRAVAQLAVQGADARTSGRGDERAAGIPTTLLRICAQKRLRE
eukprot:697014-Alexandrium_andersonii.AAC.2